MKKHVQKILVFAMAGSALVANAQVIVEENFQGFAEQGYAVANPNTTCGGKPDEATLTLNKTYTSGTAITYTLVNAAVSPACSVKAGTNLTIPIVGSNGYIELGKLSEYTVSNVTGSFTVSKLPYVGTVTFTASWTGGNRVTGSLREGVLYKSTDDGANWVVVDVTAADERNIGFSGDVYGDTYTAIIDESNVMLKFASTNDLNSQRSRVHDLTIDATAVVSVKDLFLEGSATVIANNNVVTVKSPESGIVEILGMNGVVIGSTSIAAGSEASINVNTSGLYIVKLVSETSISAKKVLVQ